MQVVSATLVDQIVKPSTVLISLHASVGASINEIVAFKSVYDLQAESIELSVLKYLENSVAPPGIPVAFCSGDMFKILLCFNVVSR